MVKTAKEVAQIFAAMPENEKVVIFWYDKEEAEIRLDRTITKKQWSEIAEATDTDGADEAFEYSLSQFEETQEDK
jgi:hypothetical protein